MIKRAFFFAAVIVCPGVAHAGDGELWTGVSASGKVTGKLRASIEITARSDRDGPYEAQIAVALGAQAGKHATFWAGVLHKALYNGPTAFENRLRQDVVLEDVARIGPVRIGGRLRAEERWRSDLAGLGWRVRPQLRLTLPLATDGPALVASAESFVNFGGGAGQRGGYDRTRLALGLSVPVTKAVRLDTAYIRQTTRGADTVDAATLMLAFRW